MNKFIKSIKKRGLFYTIVLVLNTFLYKVFRKIIFDFYLNKVQLKNNYILFYSYPDFNDNPKIFYEYMLKNYKKDNVKYIWFVDDIKNYKNSNETIFVKNKSKLHVGISLKALYYTAISKYIFFDHGSPFESLKPKKRQLVINLWHGCGYKEVSKSKKSFIESNYFDYVLVPGPIFVETKSKFFGCSKSQILDIGYPRYDLLLQNNIDTEKFVDKLKKDNKLIIWMPTFRKTGNNEYPEERVENNYDLPLLETNDDVIQLDKYCKQNGIFLIIKRHPMQVKYEAEDLKLSNILFIDNAYLERNNIELYSLLKYTDALISDYSSISVDYLLLDRPIGFVLSDFEKYQKSRGFVFEDPKKYMPGAHIYEKKDLISFFTEVSNNDDNYVEIRKKVIHQMHNTSTNYCKKIMNKVFKEIANEREAKNNEKI